MSDTKPQTADGKVLSLRDVPDAGRERPVPTSQLVVPMVMDGHRIVRVNGVELCVDTTGDAALARGIPRAELLPLEGVGHQMPPRPWWTSVIAVMLRHTCG